MDKRRILTQLFEGSPKEAEQALQRLRHYWQKQEEELEKISQAFEENLTVLEQTRYNELSGKLIFRGSQILFDNLNEEELEELDHLTEKIDPQNG